MRVLVCGGRAFEDRALIYWMLDHLHKERGISAIIQGGARGADYHAAVWAFDRKIPNVRVVADWKTHGKAAGPIRNQKMLDEQKPELVVAFPGGAGTADMTRRALLAGLKIIRVGANGTIAGD